MAHLLLIPGVVALLGLLLGLGTWVYWWRVASWAEPPLAFRQVVRLTLKRVDLAVVIPAYVRASQWGLGLELEFCKNHFRAGGDVPRLIEALLLARRHGLEFSAEQAAWIDLAGRDVIETVNQATSVEQFDVGSGVPGRETSIECATGDGLRTVWLVATASARLNLARVVGGGTLPTLAACLVKAIKTHAASHIASSPGTMEELENLRQVVLSMGSHFFRAYDLLDLELRHE